MNWFRVYNNLSPPIGLSVYDMYGKSESEQMLMGGETGRESDEELTPCSSLLWPDRVGVPIVLPLCNR